MFRLLTMSIVAALLFALAGCASVQTPKPDRFSGLPFRHSAFDFKKAWKLSPSPQGLSVDMVLRNVRYLQVDDVEVQASLLRQGKVVAQDTAYVHGSVAMDDFCKVQLLLPNASVSKGDLIYFRIQYRATEGNNSLNWTSDFSANAISGVPVRKKDEIPSED
jgi:hypothetical protein